VAGGEPVTAKRIAIVLIAGAALAGGAFLLLRSGRAGTASGQTAAPTAKAERGPIRLAVASTGRVVSNLDVDIKCRASGEVIKLPFDVSDKVKAGELLFELDPTDMQRNVDRAKAALAEATARAKYARLRAERLKQTMQLDLSSRDEYDAADATALQNEAQAEASRIALADAEQQRSYTKVVSPISGVVAARNVQMGTIIASGISNVGGGTTVMTISDLSHIFVVASVDESDIGKVKRDQSVVVTADAFAGRRFQGQVVQIATRGVTASNVTTFDVKIEVTSENKSVLKPEMTANVEIVAAEKADVLLVPVEAVSRQRGKQTVQVVPAAAGAAPEEREVETGINDGAKMEIVKGLAGGETVVLSKSADSKWKGGQQQQRPGGPPGPMLMGGPPRR
jgi:HlyD family secretion protein